MLLALEMEKGATSQGESVTSRIWKRQGNASLEPPEGNAVLPIRQFQASGTCVGLHAMEVGHGALVLFKPLHWDHFFEQQGGMTSVIVRREERRGRKQ